MLTSSRIIFFCLYVWLGFAFLLTQAAQAAQSDQVSARITDQELESLLVDARRQTGLVAVGGLVMVDGKILAKAAVGERKKGSGISVTTEDQWHLGSITKSMTATMIATLVEESMLDWQMTLPELLPDMEMDSAWADVTLHNLLTHTSGLQGNFPVKTQFERPENLGIRHEARRKALAAILAKPPKYTPGEDFVYSNVGFTLAGFIAGEKTGMVWEDLMQQRIFTPLGLESAGFGPPKGEKPLDQPWGHGKLLFAKMAKDPNGDGADNTPIMGPAGIVHMSMADLARFGNEHLLGEKGQSALLPAARFEELHKAYLEDYAYGLISVERDWAGGRLLWHNGSNTMWYAMLFILPEKNGVIVLVSNDGDIKKAGQAFGNMAKKIGRAMHTNEGKNE